MSNYAKFKENVGGDNLYLKGKDFEQGRRVGIVGWIYRDNVVAFVPFYEGWIVDGYDKIKRKDIQKPIRFTKEEGDEGDFGEDHQWAMSSFGNQSPKPQTPKPAFGFIVKDYEARTIKIATFNQATIVKSIISYIDEDDALYEPDFINKDLIIKKQDERTWKVDIRDQDEEGWSEQALMKFQWDWDLFMSCEDPTDTNITYNYVLEADVDGRLNSKPKQSAKKSAKKTAKQSAPQKSTEKSNPEEDWTKVETPKGTKFGSLSLEELKELEKILDGKIRSGKITPQHKMVVACIRGIEHHEAMKSNEEIEFEEDEFPV